MAPSNASDDKKKKKAMVEAVRKFARAAAAACETLLGVEVSGAELPGGARDSLRVSFGDRSVIVTRRGSRRRARLEASVLYALRAHGANVPKVLAFDGIWLIQEDLGGRRLSQAFGEGGAEQGEAWLDAAIASLAAAHRAGRAAGLHQSVVTIGQKPHWLPQMLEMPVRLGTLLDLPPPPMRVAELTQLLRVRQPWFIKWDARPGNAIARDDGTVAWFDWEHSGCRNRLDDVGWLLADEYTPDLPEAEARLLARHLPAFLGEDEEPKEAMTYLAAFATIHSCVRLALILTSKKDEPWWDPDMILAGDKVGVTREACRKGLVRAARWAAMTPLTEELAPWFEELIDRLPPDDG